jgi:hypothetical protein
MCEQHDNNEELLNEIRNARFNAQPCLKHDTLRLTFSLA